MGVSSQLDGSYDQALSPDGPLRTPWQNLAQLIHRLGSLPRRTPQDVLGTSSQIGAHDCGSLTRRPPWAVSELLGQIRASPTVHGQAACNLRVP